jgi:uncharacterized protein (DUF2267 family)
MSANGLEVFDKTIQTTNIWLNEVSDRTGADRHGAWRILAGVLHGLRDCLPVELAAHLGAQLPLLVRGAYYDGFAPERQPAGCDAPEFFLGALAERIGAPMAAEPEEAVLAVMAVLERHLTEGQLNKVRLSLPRAVRMIWDGADSRQLAEAGL